MNASGRQRQQCPLWFPRIEQINSKTCKVFHVAGYEDQVVMKGRGGNHSIDNGDGDPPCLAVAARSPHRSAMASVTGKIRSPNQERTSFSSQCCSTLRFWLAGSAAIPLQISPMVMTLRNTLSWAAFLRNAATRASGFSRVSSEGILVSTKYPFTD